MKTIVNILLITIISTACTNKSSQKNSIAIKEPIKGFDLSTLTLKENINDIMKQTGLQLANGKSNTFKAYGYGVFESSDPKILRYNGSTLAGKDHDSLNRVIIHYSSKDSIIGLVEINLFTASEIKALNAGLEKKLGKAVYPSDAYDYKPFSKNMQFRDYVWVDTIATVGHFMMHSMVLPPHEAGNLAIVNYSNILLAELTGLKGYTSSVPADILGAKRNMKRKLKNRH